VGIRRLGRYRSQRVQTPFFLQGMGSPAAVSVLSLEQPSGTATSNWACCLKGYCLAAFKDNSKWATHREKTRHPSNPTTISHRLGQVRVIHHQHRSASHLGDTDS
jgi:hypothetical protein